MSATMQEMKVLGSLSAEEAISWLVKESRRLGKTPSQIIEDGDLDMLRPEAIRRFALQGWWRAANQGNHVERVALAQQETKENSSRGVHPRDGRFGDVLSLMWQGAGGIFKEIGDFASNDLEFLYKEARLHMVGWKRKCDFAVKAEAALRKNPSAKTLRNLPAKALGEIREAAAEAWR